MPLLASVGAPIAVGNIEAGPRENPGIREVDDRPRSRFHASIYFGFSMYHGFDKKKGGKQKGEKKPLTPLHFSPDIQSRRIRNFWEQKLLPRREFQTKHK